MAHDEEILWQKVNLNVLFLYFFNNCPIGQTWGGYYNSNSIASCVNYSFLFYFRKWFWVIKSNSSYWYFHSMIFHFKQILDCWMLLRILWRHKQDDSTKYFVGKVQVRRYPRVKNTRDVFPENPGRGPSKI